MYNDCQIINVEIPSTSKKSYPIIIGSNILKEAGKIIKENTPSTKLLVVSNETVFPLYGNKFIESLINNGLKVESVILPDGEDFKNLEYFKFILDKALDYKLERKDSIVALGGGVIGDMAGYAAASYLRGINLVQIPTTLLAQVDSSVGGKVGINHEKGKNLIGAFYQPKCVIIDNDTLKTLDLRNIKNGLAEIIKYAFIEKTCNYSKEYLNFYDFLYNNRSLIYELEPNVTREMISYSCKLKASVVEQDEKESGLRAILNMGHTTGHALEVCGYYKILTHGEGVSIGTVAALKIAKNKGLLSPDLVEKGEAIIKLYELPYKIPDNISIYNILEAMKLDKKVQKAKVRFILPDKSIGEVGIFDDVTEEQLMTVLNEMY